MDKREERPFAAFIGIDWADKKHDVCFWVPGGEKRERLVLEAALRALAFKWIRVLHRCWTDRVVYDESRYLMALQKRHAPLLKFAAAPSP